MTGAEPVVDELARVQAQLYARVDAYHALGSTRDVDGWDLWVLCARNAAWAGLVATSWNRVAALVPPGLFSVAAHNSVFHYDGERIRWRALAGDVARSLPVETAGT